MSTNSHKCRLTQVRALPNRGCSDRIEPAARRQTREHRVHIRYTRYTRCTRHQTKLNGGLGEEEARRLFSQVVDAVHYLHTKKDIAHRDIKVPPPQPPHTDLTQTSHCLMLGALLAA